MSSRLIQGKTETNGKYHHVASFGTIKTKVCFKPWSSLIEGDEQLDRPNGQTSVECGYMCAESIFYIFHNHNNFPFGLILLFISFY